MQSYKEARCQHIKGEGTQCGSPALRDKKFCYYHEQCRWRDVECYDGEDPYSTGEIKMPAFDDAHSIQYVIRQVTILLLQKRIDPKTAGLLFYGLPIASSNLKRMELERPRPTRVVVDPEKVEETPIGMTPWSASGEGHDVEEEPRAEGKGNEPRNRDDRDKDEEDDRAERLADEVNAGWEKEYGIQRDWMVKQAKEIGGWLGMELPPEQLKGVLEAVKFSLELSAEFMGHHLPPGTIQACASPYSM